MSYLRTDCTIHTVKNLSDIVQELSGLHCLVKRATAVSKPDNPVTDASLSA
jgi:hypothetical protein